MTKHELENALRQSLQRTPANPPHIQDTLLLARQALRLRSTRNRLSFWGFLGSQVRFIGWKIWLFQAFTLLPLTCLIFSLWHSIGASPRSAGILLSGCSLLIFMTALPFLHRSKRYQMCEMEMAVRFSGVTQLVAKLLIISVGDLAMLTSIFCFVIVKFSLEPDSVFFYLLLPFLTAASGLLYLIRHTPGSKLPQNSVLVCGLLFLGLALLTMVPPVFLPRQSSPLWWVICTVLAGCCAYQTRSVFYQSSFEEIQLL